MSNLMKIDDWLSAIPSKQTRKCYRAGIKKFEEFYKAFFQGIKPESSFRNWQKTDFNLEWWGSVSVSF